MTKSVTLDEIVSYSDFSQEVVLEELAVQEFVEDLPDQTLLNDAFSKKVVVNGSSLHIIPDGKCTDIKSRLAVFDV